jgi:hypothetical protein
MLGEAPAAASSLSNSDFYVAAATVIPVVFLGLVLQGGLWEWISQQIITDRRPAVLSGSLSGSFVSALQIFALVILFGGTVGEIMALYVLWQQQAGSWVGYVVFISAAFLVALLGVTLAAKVPGILFYKSDEPVLRLEFREKILWSASCLQSPEMLPMAKLKGRLFLTDARLVFMEYRSLTSPKPVSLEIRLDKLVSISESATSLIETMLIGFLAMLLDPMSFLKFKPRLSSIDIHTKVGNSYRFLVSVADGQDAAKYLRAYVTSNLSNT